MATTYTSDNVFLVRRYQVVNAYNEYVSFVVKKMKYGAASPCMKKKLILLSQWVDIYLRYNNPSNSTEEALNCLTEAQIDHILEQISKMTGCKFYGKDTIWESYTYPIIENEAWQWNDNSDIQWNDDDSIDTNIIL